MDAAEPSLHGPDAALSGIAAASAARMGAENFPVALRVLPARPRARLVAVYGFARFVDDVGDRAPGDAHARLRLLDTIEADLRALPAGEAALPAVTALADVLAATDVGLEPFLDLIEANRIDQSVASYATFDDLLGYCRFSAAPVGRIVLHVAGAATPENLADSDAVCAALQVLEHGQDVGEDARMGRVYLPADDRRAAGVTDAELRGTVTGAALRGVVATQVERSEALLRTGAPLVRRLRGWARIAVAGYVAGGRATAAALRRADHDVLGSPVRPSRAVTALHALRLVTPW
jgi:squalene synthase HpnC